jgi:hypothetical protein
MNAPREEVRASMRIPSFFDDVPAIVVRDPLADLLGAAQEGRIVYEYVDAVKLAGHSCPTVASSWLMTAKALAHLYPDALPERGAIKVEVRGAQDEGTEGVSGMIAGLITGAAGAGGFKGIAGHYDRRNLIEFGAPIRGRMRFTRLDTRQAVEVDYHPECVPMPPDTKALMADAMVPSAGDGRRRALARRWQGWVKAILIDHRDDADLVGLLDAAPVS